MSTISLVKHGFFRQPPARHAKAISFRESEFDLNQLRTEFFTLYQIFIASKGLLDSKSKLVLYLRKIGNTLIRYYRLDYVEEDLQDFLDKKKEIDSFIAGKPVLRLKGSQNGFSTFIGDRLHQNYLEFIHSFSSSSKFRNIVSLLISNRSYWSYSRTLANCIVIYLLDSQFVEFIREINAIIGFNTTPEEVLKALETPQAILRTLSIFLYSLRFIINLIMLIKHVIRAIGSRDLSATKVLLQEIEKRFYLMLNDLAWGIVNLLGSYNQFFDIPLPVVSQINLAFLAFDILLFFASWYVEQRKYARCTEELLLQRENAVSGLERATINRQLDILEDEWSAQCAYYQFNISAAVLLMIAFGISLVVSGGVALVVLAALSMLGNALYNSCNEYKKYKLTCIAVERELMNGSVLADDYHYELLNELEIECQKASHKFWISLIFNAAFTAFVITTAAISWPVAVAITVSYLAYKLWDAYSQSKDKNNKERPSQNVYRLFNATAERQELPETEVANTLLLT